MTAHRITKLIFLVVLFDWSCSEYVAVPSAIPNLPVNDLVVMYYADLNDDQTVDMLLYSSSKTNIYAILMNEASTEVKSLLTAPSSGSLSLQSIVVSDFTGDSLGDIMICMGSISESNCELWIAISSDYMKFNHFKKLEDLASQPLVFDLNSDLASDIYGSNKGTGRVIISMSKSENKLVTKPLSDASSLSNLKSFPYLAIVDVTGDGNADILEITTSNGVPSINVIPRIGSKFNFDQIIVIPRLPESVEHVGLPCFADFDNDLNIDMVLPVCTDPNCSLGLLYMYSFYQKKWSKLALSGYISPLQLKKNHHLNEVIQLPDIVNIHCGDANQDSRVDILVASNEDVVMYQNNADGKFVGKKVINLDGAKVLQISFFDYQENGIPDILLNVLKNSTNELRIYKSTLDIHQDINYFSKVSVVIPSSKSKKDISLPYPGSLVSLTMLGLDGKDYQMAGSLIPQTNYLALSLPHIIFGLGSSPNFIDTMTITIPSKRSTPTRKEINSLMPNSQVYVITNSDGSPMTHRVIIRPESKKSLLYVGLTLIGTFIVCSLFVAALQLKEYFQDKREKEIEARKFNFDAM